MPPNERAELTSSVPAEARSSKTVTGSRSKPTSGTRESARAIVAVMKMAVTFLSSFVGRRRRDECEDTRPRRAGRSPRAPCPHARRLPALLRGLPRPTLRRSPSEGIDAVIVISLAMSRSRRAVATACVRVCAWSLPMALPTWPRRLLRGQEQPLADLLARETVGGQAEDLAFARGQPARALRVDEDAASAGSDVDASGGHHVDGAHQVLERGRP